jgi:hypothetical protein
VIGIRAGPISDLNPPPGRWGQYLPYPLAVPGFKKMDIGSLSRSACLSYAVGIVVLLTSVDGRNRRMTFFGSA